MLKKSVAIITAACFIYSSVLAQSIWGITAPAINPVQSEATLTSLAIPASVGRITSSRHFDNSLPIVVNIQDLHCHPGVQRNISKILEFLDKQYGLKKVYVEGGIGELNTSWLCDIKDNNLKHDLAESLVDKGRITGTEYYSALSNRPALLLGIEEEKPYKENLVRLGKIIENKERYTQVSQRLGTEIEVLKEKYLNSEQKRFETVVREYKEGKIKTEKYYRQLKKYREVLRLDNSDNYKNIDTYLEIIKDYKSLDYKKTTKQLQEFITLLKQKLPYSAYVSLLEETDNFSRADLLPTYVVQLARQYNLSFDKRHSELSRYVAYLEKNQSINPLELIREEKKLVEDVRSGFIRNTDQENISYIVDMFGYSEDCLNNRLSAEDYEYFTERFEKYKLLLPRYTGNNIFASLEKDFALLNEYYSVNFKRNNCFMEHIQNDLARQITSSHHATKEVLVVVSGGFHSTGIEQLLEKRHISYVTVTPNAAQDTEQSDNTYLEIARQQAKIFSQNMIAVYMASNKGAEATLLQDQAIREYLTEKDIAAARKNNRSFAAKALKKALPGIDKLTIETVYSAMADMSKTWNSQFGGKYGEMSVPVVIENKNGTGFTIVFKPSANGDQVTEPLMFTCDRQGKIAYEDFDKTDVNESNQYGMHEKGIEALLHFDIDAASEVFSRVIKIAHHVLSYKGRYTENIFTNPQMYRDMILKHVRVTPLRPSHVEATWFPTRFCPVGCADCMFASAMGKKLDRNRDTTYDSEGVDRLIAFIDQAKIQQLTVVGGGEPLLEKESVLDVIRRANVKTMVIVTSGFWGKKSDDARKMILDIYEALNMANERRETEGLPPLQLFLRISLDQFHVQQLTWLPFANIIREFHELYTEMPGFRNAPIHLYLKTLNDDPAYHELCANLERTGDVKVLNGINMQIPELTNIDLKGVITFNDGFRVIVRSVDLLRSDAEVDMTNDEIVDRNLKIYEAKMEEKDQCKTNTMENSQDVLSGKGEQTAWLDWYLFYDGHVQLWRGTATDNISYLYRQSFQEILSQQLADIITVATTEKDTQFVDRIVEEVDPHAVLRAKLVNIPDFHMLAAVEVSKLRLYVTLRLLQEYLQEGRVSEQQLKALPGQLYDLILQPREVLMGLYHASDYTIVDDYLDYPDHPHYVDMYGAYTNDKTMVTKLKKLARLVEKRHYSDVDLDTMRAKLRSTRKLNKQDKKLLEPVIGKPSDGASRVHADIKKSVVILTGPHSLEKTSLGTRLSENTGLKLIKKEDLLQEEARRNGYDTVSDYLHYLDAHPQIKQTVSGKVTGEIIRKMFEGNCIVDDNLAPWYATLLEPYLREKNITVEYYNIRMRQNEINIHPEGLALADGLFRRSFAVDARQREEIIPAALRETTLRSMDSIEALSTIVKWIIENVDGKKVTDKKTAKSDTQTLDSPIEPSAIKDKQELHLPANRSLDPVNIDSMQKLLSAM